MAACEHKRTRVIAQDDDSEYLECLDCGAILERGELSEGPAFNESLSDA
jgi:transcription initiation factor TFIIIB Brf1 subunit/transcription initiation factor TFIIB